MSEKDTQKAILDWLAAKQILAFRMNSGATLSSYKGKTRMVRYGMAGMADILAMPNEIPGCPQKDDDGCLERVGSREWICNNCSITLLPVPRPVWIEVKADKGKQSDPQKSFQSQVEGHGHRYILARSLDDVIEALQ